MSHSQSVQIHLHQGGYLPIQLRPSCRDDGPNRREVKATLAFQQGRTTGNCPMSCHLKSAGPSGSTTRPSSLEMRSGLARDPARWIMDPEAGFTSAGRPYPRQGDPRCGSPSPWSGRYQPNNSSTCWTGKAWRRRYESASRFASRSGAMDTAWPLSRGVRGNGGDRNDAGRCDSDAARRPVCRDSGRLGGDTHTHRLRVVKVRVP